MESIRGFFSWLTWSEQNQSRMILGFSKKRLFQRSILQSSPSLKRPNGVGGGCCCWWWWWWWWWWCCCCCRCCCHSWQWLVKNGECCLEMLFCFQEIHSLVSLGATFLPPDLYGNYLMKDMLWGPVMFLRSFPFAFSQAPYETKQDTTPRKFQHVFAPEKWRFESLSFLFGIALFVRGYLKMSGISPTPKIKKKIQTPMPLVHIWPQPWRKSVGPKSPVSRKSRTSPTITVASPEFSEARKSKKPCRERSHIPSHRGKFGKSSTQKWLLMGYASSQEGMYTI